MENMARILYAEDDGVRARLVRARLEGAGFAVRVVADGRAALEAYREDRPDVLLLDVEMPEMDGEELTRLIRRDDRRIQILAYTSHVEPERHRALLDAGVNSFIPKEESLALLVSYVEKAVREATARMNGAYVYALSPRTRYNGSGEVLVIDGKAVALNSQTQAAALTVLCEHFNRVVSQSVLIERLWGGSTVGKEKMLGEVVSRLRRLLRSDDSLRIYFRENGYKLCSLGPGE